MKMTAIHVVIEVLENLGYVRTLLKDNNYSIHALPEGHYYFNNANYIVASNSKFEIDFITNHEAAPNAHVIIRKIYRDVLPRINFKEPAGYINFCEPDSLEQLKRWMDEDFSPD